MQKRQNSVCVAVVSGASGDQPVLLTMKMNATYSPEHFLRRVEDIVHLSVTGTDGILHLLGRDLDSTGVSASA